MEKSVVRINRRLGTRGEKISSGVVVLYRGTSHVLTNFHCVSDNSDFGIHGTGLSVNGNRAKLVAAIPALDMAIVSVSGLDGIPIMNFDNRVGNRVDICGFPIGLSQSNIISGKIISADDNTLHINAVVQPGMSGGLVFNDNGGCGMLCKRYPDGTCSAISGNVIKRMLSRDLPPMTELCYLNIRTQKMGGLHRVRDVAPHGTCGGVLQVGDILTVSDESVNLMRPGDKIKLDVVRDCAPIQVSVSLKTGTQALIPHLACEVSHDYFEFNGIYFKALSMADFPDKFEYSNFETSVFEQFKQSPEQEIVIISYINPSSQYKSNFDIIGKRIHDVNGFIVDNLQDVKDRISMYQHPIITFTGNFVMRL